MLKVLQALLFALSLLPIRFAHAGYCGTLFSSPLSFEISGSEISLQLEPKISFDAAGASIKVSSLSPEGDYVSLVTNTDHLIVQRTSDGQVVAVEKFARIDVVQFLGTSSDLAISGVLPGAAHSQLHLLQIRPESRQNYGNLDMPMSSSFLSRHLISPASLRNQKIKTIDLPKTSTAIHQIIARPDLPNSLIIESTPHPHAYALKDMASLTEVEFDGLIPIAAQLNPYSSMLALHVVDHLDSQGENNSVVAVDMAHPNLTWFRHKIGRKDDVSMNWSRDGHRLVIAEKTSGAVAVHDFVTNLDTIWTTENPTGDETIGAEPLSSGKILVLRKSPIGDINGYLLGAQSALNPEVSRFALHLKNNWGAYMGATELKHGQIWALLFENRIVFLDCVHPERFTVVTPAPGNRISSIIQISDTKLRISDELRGVFDIQIN